MSLFAHLVRRTLAPEGLLAPRLPQGFANWREPAGLEVEAVEAKKPVRVGDPEPVTFDSPRLDPEAPHRIAATDGPALPGAAPTHVAVLTPIVLRRSSAAASPGAAAVLLQRAAAAPPVHATAPRGASTVTSAPAPIALAVPELRPPPAIVAPVPPGTLAPLPRLEPCVVPADAHPGAAELPSRRRVSPAAPPSAPALTAPLTLPRAPPPTAAPDVIISIGRVEVRAAVAAPAPRTVRPPAAPPLSLADYLGQRSGTVR